MTIFTLSSNLKKLNSLNSLSSRKSDVIFHGIEFLLIENRAHLKVVKVSVNKK